MRKSIDPFLREVIEKLEIAAHNLQVALPAEGSELWKACSGDWRFHAAYEFADAVRLKARDAQDHDDFEEDDCN